jgi:hypothetical protein
VDLHGGAIAVGSVRALADAATAQPGGRDPQPRRPHARTSTTAGYDLAQIALRMIDYVVLQQANLEGSVSPAAALDRTT